MTTRVITDDELAALLDTLGQEADDIAERMRAQKVTGIPGDGDQCPIANWLKREVSDIKYVDVDGGRIDAIIQGELFVRCLMSDQVASFVSNFDRGDYADLREYGEPDDQ